MSLQELKDTITAQGQSFIWLTDAGWYFHEQPEALKLTREQVLAAESFEQLMTIKPDAPASEEQIIEQPKKAQRKK